MRVVFMGTPEFAVPCLESIVSAGHELCGVYTRRDKPKGRGRLIAMSPVKEWAAEHSVRVFQPATLKDGGEDSTLAELAPDVIVVTAYGCILPSSVLHMPKYGCINVHASLLPKYRGAGPIQWSIINGEKETGVTTMFMAEGIDTGDMILRAKTRIGENETAGELQERLSLMGAKLLNDTLAMLESGKIAREKQDESQATIAPMLDKTLSRINWNLPAETIHNLIRGLNPWPCAASILCGKRLKILKSLKTGRRAQGKAPGEVAGCSDEGIEVCCGDGFTLLLAEVQEEGKRKMRACEYLCGHKISAGTVLSHL